MIFFGGARQIGKTTKMIDWLKSNKHRTLLVHHLSYANDLKRQYPEVAPQIDTFWHYVNAKGGYWPRTKEIAIDNIDIILAQMFKAPIKYVTFTGSVHFRDSFGKESRKLYEESEDERYH